MQQNMMCVATFFWGGNIGLWIVFSVHGHAVHMLLLHSKVQGRNILSYTGNSVNLDI